MFVLVIFSTSAFNSLSVSGIWKQLCCARVRTPRKTLSNDIWGNCEAMFYCHPFCTASACPSIWMNIILKGPVIHKLPEPARSYRAGLNWAWVIQTPSEAGLIIPPYAVAVNISEAMPLVVEQVSSAYSVQSKYDQIWCTLLSKLLQTITGRDLNATDAEWKMSIMFSRPTEHNMTWCYFIAVFFLQLTQEWWRYSI